MNNEDLLETKEIGNYRIRVWRDDFPICPLKDWDMTGMFLFSDYGRGRLSSYSSFDNKVLYDGNSYTLEEALEHLIDHYVPYDKLLSYLKGGGLGSVKLQYDRSLRCWHVMYYDDRYNKRYEETFTVDELRSGCTGDFTGYIDYDDLVTIMRDCAKDVAICEWSSRGYCQGDYVCGIAYCDKERYAKMYGAPTKGWKERAISNMESESECIGKWMWGDVIGYTLESKVPYTKVYDDGRDSEHCCEWDEEDSCWGFYCDSDELIKDVISEHNLDGSNAA